MITKKRKADPPASASHEAPEVEFRVAWLNEVLDAEHWLAIPNVKPKEAAMLLCRLNPHSEKNPEKTSSDETTPEDYKRLLRDFEGVQETDEKPRNLLEWRDIARQHDLKYHSWIDFYEQTAELPKTSGDTDGAEHTNNGRSDKFDVFCTMDGLHPTEVTITLYPNNLIEFAARGNAIRVNQGSAGFIDNRNGNFNTSWVILLCLADGRLLNDAELSKVASNPKKAISNLRSHLKGLLGFTQNPFFSYNKTYGWKPCFKLIDKRGAADVYARGARLSFDALGEEQVSRLASDAIQNDDENDEAARWLKENG